MFIQHVRNFVPRVNVAKNTITWQPEIVATVVATKYGIGVSYVNDCEETPPVKRRLAGVNIAKARAEHGFPHVDKTGKPWSPPNKKIYVFFNRNDLTPTRTTVSKMVNYYKEKLAAKLEKSNV